jgi:hypothetical protein
MKPPKGESVTVWADRESEYRSGLRPANKRAKKGPDSEVSIEPVLGQLAVVELTQAARKALEAIAGLGVLVLKPKDGGALLALAIVPLDGLTAEKPSRSPGLRSQQIWHRRAGRAAFPCRLARSSGEADKLTMRSSASISGLVRV